jgi:hypothetical protein
MKWADHKRLIYAVTQQYSVPWLTNEGLLDGVVYPDIINDQRKKSDRRLEPHHQPDKDNIIKLIWEARNDWLIGKERKAGFQLGCALHFVHDGIVGKGFLGLFHDSNEKKLRTIDINRQIISSGINESESDPFCIEDLIISINYKNNPEKALDRASYITAFLISGVFNYNVVPIEVKNEFERVCKERKNLLGRIINNINGKYDIMKKKWAWYKGI